MRRLSLRPSRPTKSKVWKPGQKNKTLVVMDCLNFYQDVIRRVFLSNNQMQIKCKNSFLQVTNLTLFYCVHSLSFCFHLELNWSWHKILITLYPFQFVHFVWTFLQSMYWSKIRSNSRNINRKLHSLTLQVLAEASWPEAGPGHCCISTIWLEF